METEMKDGDLRETSKYEVELDEHLPDGTIWYRYYETSLWYRYAKPAFDELKKLIGEGVHGTGVMTLSIKNMDPAANDSADCVLRFKNCRLDEE
ncbi:MAG: hypothetical protein LBQ97_05670 [Fusobacteriaceae bacterium]|jgi:hypothetical protein|nr:hypothetical protein [Fusobacteriaceae bacterium]